MVVDRNGHRWNDAPDGGEDMALEALKVALSVEFSQVRTKRFEVPLPQPPHHRPPTILILCPTQGPPVSYSFVHPRNLGDSRPRILQMEYTPTLHLTQIKGKTQRRGQEHRLLGEQMGRRELAWIILM